MENTNADDQLDVVGQEEVTSEDFNNDSDSSDDVVTISKSKLNSMRRKALAYEANKEKPSSINNSKSDAQRFEKLELMVKGYNEEETKHILKNGGVEALSNPFVLAGIESLREQKRAEAAMLGSEGQKSTSTGGLSNADFSKLSADEQLKQLEQL